MALPSNSATRQTSPQWMKIVNRQPEQTADISSARGKSFSEFRKLLLWCTLSIVGLYFVIGLVVDSVVKHISIETEAALFGSFQEDNEMLALENDPVKARLNRLLDQLKSHPDVPDLPYKITLIEENQPNAFAFPGGTIGITQGLVDVIDEDIAIAFVLAHELGHFYHRDHLRGIGRALGMSIALSLLSGGNLGNADFQNLLSAVLDKNYSRQQEAKADAFGIRLVYEIFGKTEGTDALFRHIDQEAQLPAWTYMFATHPHPRKRIELLKAQVEQLRLRSVEAMTTE